MFKNKVVLVEIIIVSEWKIIGFMGPEVCYIWEKPLWFIVNEWIMNTKLHMEANNCLKWQKQNKLQILVIWKI